MLIIKWKNWYAAKNVNIEANKGEILGLVESGSGKSTVGNAIINLIDEPGKVSGGSVILGTLIFMKILRILLNTEVIKLVLCSNPQTSLNPILTVGEQLIKLFKLILNWTKRKPKNL